MMSMPRPSSTVFFPESGETASPSSSPSPAYLMAEVTADGRVEKGERDLGGGTNRTGGMGCGGDGGGFALIKNSLMKPASDKVSSVRAWQLSHKPGMDVYGNDSVQRGQAGQPVVLSLSLSGSRSLSSRLSESSFCYLKRCREFSGGK